MIRQDIAHPRGAFEGGGWRTWRILLALAFLLALAACLAMDFSIARALLPDSDVIQPYNESLAIHGGNFLLHGWVVSIDNFYFTDILPTTVLGMLIGSESHLIYVAPFLGFCTLLLASFVLVLQNCETVAQRYAGLFAVLFLIGLPFGPIAYYILHSAIHIGTITFCLFALALIGPALASSAFRRTALIPFALLIFMIAASDPFGDVFFVAPLLGTLLLRAALYRRIAPDEARIFACALSAGLVGFGFPYLMGAGLGFSTVPTISTSPVSPGRIPETAWALLRALQTQYAARPDLLHGAMAAPVIAATRALAGLAVAGLCARALWKMPRQPANGVVQVLICGAMALIAADLLSQNFLDGIEHNAWFPGRGGRYVTPIFFFTALAGAIEGARLLPIRAAATRLACLVAALLAAPFVLEGARVALRDAGQPSGAMRSPQMPLTQWLLAHRFRYGVGDYWTSQMVLALSRHGIETAPVVAAAGKLVYYRWNSDASAWPRMNPPQFVAFPTLNDSGITTAVVRASYPSAGALHRVGDYIVIVVRAPEPP